jgi:hypothetical protein
MAVATATIVVNAYPSGIDNTARFEIVRGKITISTGGTYPPGGFPLNWSGIEGLKVIPAASLTPSSTGTILPVDMDINSAANPPSGYIYTWDNVNGNLHILESNNGVSGNSGPLVELGGAIPNTIVTDVIQFRASFVRN